MKTTLNLFSVFHLNLAFSAIQEEDRKKVIECCYWPLLNLVESLNIPVGIEATGYTLEVINKIDPVWLEKLQSLLNEKKCQFIGSGYSQVIGPLVPARVNEFNLNIGNSVYQKLLGVKPKIAMVNEQAYSCGLVGQYLKANYSTILMEWDNPSSSHPEWPRTWRYWPQYAVDQWNEKIQVIWNQSIIFQKFQRYAHAEIEQKEFIGHLETHLDREHGYLSLYGNDVEVFDFRPGRFETEAKLAKDGEWIRIAKLYEALLKQKEYSLVLPGDVLKGIGEANAGKHIQLESAEQPIPVKKQAKYNITRWAVSGRDDLGINTRCWRVYEKLSEANADPADWKELCYLWSSDFRTHITEKRWNAYLERLNAVERKYAVHVLSPKRTKLNQDVTPNTNFGPRRDGRFLVFETEKINLNLNCSRGLAIDRLVFKDLSDQPLIGTLPHGHFEKIDWSPDFYTGHLVFEEPGQHKVTDLEAVEPVINVDENRDATIVEAQVATRLGPILKTVRVFKNVPCVEFEYRITWEPLPIGSLRLGMITIIPESFDGGSLFFETHNGGRHPEKFSIQNRVSHSAPLSFLRSARHALGISEGYLAFGDKESQIQIGIKKTDSALIGLVEYEPIGDSYFFRIIFSAQEMDETSRQRTVVEGNYRETKATIRIEPKTRS